MSDDDHTVDADPDTLDTIRRLVARADESRDGRPPQPVPTDTDSPTDHTVDADDSTLDQIRQLAEQAVHRAEPGSAPDAAEPRSQHQLPDWPETQLPEPARLPVRPQASEDPWRPPSRSVRLEPDQRRADNTTHKWRLATAVLAVFVVVLLIWVLFGGDAAPTDSPTNTTVPAGTPVSGSVGEGGAGG